MFEITRGLQLDEQELTLTFARSGGPGGQNVNKVSSKVVLRWNPGQSAGLPDEVRIRLLSQQRARLTKDGELLITSQKTRDQARNVEDCLEKLRSLIFRALIVPRRRAKPLVPHAERRNAGYRRRSTTLAARKNAAAGQEIGDAACRFAPEANAKR